ncbi:hypothetical protein OH77DRAFT_1493660 [Trametes cingulata]|nr:hypothetical protein OH77DRAFT_1493660 [Trametes cingulata]
MSSPRAIAAMMGTCRTLYRESEGARLLLRRGVSLARDNDIVSFSRFMLADAPARFPHLRKLTVSRGMFADDAVAALKTLLTHPALEIDSLVLRDAESVLSSGSSPQPALEDASCAVDWHPPLLGAFASLTTLRHLTLADLDERAYALLRMLPPGLVSATLLLDSPRARWGDPDARNPIVHLAAQADTLEALCGTGFDVHPDHVAYDVVYPRVRRIQAEYTSRAMPATVAYVHAFPNVEHLALMGERPGDDSDSEFDLDFDEGHEEEQEEGEGEWERGMSMRSRRNGHVPEPDPFTMQSVRAQRASNQADQTHYGSFARLRRVAGSVVDVYRLGLVCHVPELRLRGDVTRPLAPMLRCVVDDVRPARLALTVVGGGPMFAEGGAVRALCAEPMAQCVRALELEVCFAPSEGDVDVGVVLENIFQTLIILPLHTLKLTLNHGLLSPPGRAGRSSHHCPAARTLDALDVTEYARRFRNAIPSLRKEEEGHVEVRRISDAGPHRYLLGPYGGSRHGSPAEFSDEEEWDWWTERRILDLGFGVAVNEEFDDGW